MASLVTIVEGREFPFRKITWRDKEAKFYDGQRVLEKVQPYGPPGCLIMSSQRDGLKLNLFERVYSAINHLPEQVNAFCIPPFFTTVNPTTMRTEIQFYIIE